MTYKRLLAIVAAVLFQLLPQIVLAQNTPYPPPPNPIWWTALNGSPRGEAASPDGACRIQHDYYNPGAPYQPPTKSSESLYNCHWIASQFGGGPGSNTVLPSSVFLDCGSAPYGELNGRCINHRFDLPDCGCGSGGGNGGGGDDGGGGGTGGSGGWGSGGADGATAPPGMTAADPVSINTGNKLEYTTDYASADGQFAVKRRYSSGSNRAFPEPFIGFGESWQGVIPGPLQIVDGNMNNIVYSDGNSSGQLWFGADSNNLNSWSYGTGPATRARLSLVTTPTVSRDVFVNQASVSNGPAEFRLDYANGEYILFRRSNFITGHRDAVPIEKGQANGYRLYYDYPDTGLFPSAIRDNLGRRFGLTWTSYDLNPTPGAADVPFKAISVIALPDGTTLNYDYEAANFTVTTNATPPVTTVVPGRVDRLVAVRRLGASSALIWKRSYLYENTTFPYALTGEKDRNDQRVSTTSYDQAGLVASAERAVGVDKYLFSTSQNVTQQYFAENFFSRDVTNPLGHTQHFELTYDAYFRPGNSTPLIHTITGYASAHVPADSITINYAGTAVTPLTYGSFDARNVQTSMNIDTGNLLPATVFEAIGLPEARTTNFTWHPTFDLPTQKQLPGLTIDYTYGAQGQLLTRSETSTTTQTVPYATTGQKRTWTYVWQANGRLASIDGPKPIVATKNDIVTFAYDASNNLQTETNGLAQITSFAGYDANGRPATMTDPNGIVTAFVYDSLGRTTSVTVRHPTIAAQNATTTFEYDGEGRVIGVTLPGTDKLITDYDPSGRVTAVRAASGERIDFARNAMGGVTQQTITRADASIRSTISRTFDELNRVLTLTLGPNRTKAYQYDPNGNVTQVTSARSNATTFAFDGINRLTTSVASDTGNVTNAYDALDSVTAHTDAIAVQTGFVRDGFGDALSETSPDRGTSVYYYDLAGDQVAAVDGRGQRVNYTRDVLGRVTLKAPVAVTGQNVTYTYDAGTYGKGHLTKVVDISGTTSLAYDHRGNLITKTQTIGSTSASLKYTYDLADRVARITYPSGRIADYVRDSKGRITSVTTAKTATASSVTIASAIAFEAFGPLKSLTYGNGLTLAQGWGTDERLYARAIKRANGTNLWASAYAYDNDDNITSITDLVDATKSVTYGYDGENRLTQTIGTFGTTHRFDYLLDKNGNRTRVEARDDAAQGTPTSFTDYALTAGTNRLASVGTGAAQRSIGYDARGNTTTETRPAGVTLGTGYDAHGRLTSYNRSDAPTQANVYNGLDDRVSATATTGGVGDTHRYVYDSAGRLIGDYGTSPSDVRGEFIWLQPEVANDNSFTSGDGIGGYALLAVATGPAATPTIQYVHTNQLGTPVATTDASGNPVTPASYAALGFPGQTRTLADLYYNRYRDYDPTTGRYIQADPIGLQGGVNAYLYAGGNPLKWTDAPGTGPIGTALGGAVGGAAGGILGAGACAELGPGAVICAVGGRYFGRRGGAAAGSAIEDAIKSCVSGGKGKDPQCHKATRYELEKAGIFDEHKFKTESGAVPTSRFDICKCKDGSIRIAAVNTCGSTSHFWD